MPTEEGSFLDLNLEDTPELGPVPGGEEYLLTLLRASVAYGSTNGRDWGRITTIHEVADNDTADDIYHTLWLPMEDDPPKSQIRSKNTIKNFMLAHGIDISGEFNPEDWTGQGYQAYAILREEEDNTGRTVNRVQRWTVSA